MEPAVDPSVSDSWSRMLLESSPAEQALMQDLLSMLFGYEPEERPTVEQIPEHDGSRL